MFKTYYKLTKPGIVYGNVFTTIAAFLFALQGHFFVPGALEVFLATVVGLGLVIASACVFNNYIDRDIDRKMERTSTRALVTGAVSARAALIYASALGLIGLALLVAFVNILTALLALIGFIFYVIIYGIAKRRTSWGAVVGSIPGAVPIVVGYTAVTNQLDLAALILFLVMVVWQMPHFYAIAMYRLDEYRAAGLPVLPAKKGMHRTKIHIALYVFAFLLVTEALWALGFAGFTYFVVILVLGLTWLVRALQGFSKINTDDTKWAKGIFFFSLIALLIFCAMISAASFLP